MRRLLPLIFVLAGCQAESTQRANFPDDARVRADVRTHLANNYQLALADDAINVQFGCAVQNSQCGFSVGVYPEDSGLSTHFLLWPTYTGGPNGMALTGIDDNLRSQLIRAAIEARVDALFVAADFGQATLRINEYHGYVAIEKALPTDIDALRKLDADTLLRAHGADIGLDLRVYVYAEPAAFEPQARAAVARLLAEPLLHLGKGFDIVWDFRSEPPTLDAKGRVQLDNASNRWLPDSSPDNTRARWRLRLTGTRYGDDLTQPVEQLWKTLDRTEPFAG